MTKKKVYLFVFIICLAGYVWLLLNLYIHSISMEVCIFHKVTHLPCPSCGSTRSVLALLNGNLKEAIYYNPFGLFVVLLATVLPLWLLFDLITNKSGFFHFYQKLELHLKRKWIALFLILLVLANWIWNFFKYL